MKNFARTSMLAALALSLAACVTTNKDPDPVPPKMVKSVTGGLVWDRADAFGSVPADMQARGDKECAAIGVAIGYHPAAQGVDGNTFPAGAFLCGAK